MRLLPLNTALLCLLSVILLSGPAQAANPSADQALKLVPVQAGVDFDRPTAAEAAKCKILAKKIDGQVGWIIESPNGTILRRFIDTNGDNIVDQWSYFKDGIEVYRDIDSNYNGKADQYRWFNTGGSRWAIDKNEDGEIDAWKTISAEEVTAEIVASIATHDANRFARLMLTDDELNSLGLGTERTENIAEKIAKATAAFKAMSARQKTLGQNAVWVQFSAGLPGVVPAGTDHSTKDVRVYENVTAIAESDGQHRQVQIGTLVQVGDTWRAINLPQIAAEGQAEAAPEGLFFRVSLPVRNETDAAGAGGMTQKLLADLENLDKEAVQAVTAADQAKYTERRADLLQQIADASKSPDQRAMWFRQLADMLSAAVQSGTYDGGAKRLDSLYEKLSKNETDKDIAAYVKFRQLTAAYFLAMKAPKADFAKIQANWLKTLEQYAADYPNSPDAAEAMLQLAISEEFGGEEDAAKKWYRKIADQFPDSAPAQKASRGADPHRLGRPADQARRPKPAGKPRRSGRPSRQGRADPVLGDLVRPGQDRHGHAQGAVEQVRPLVHRHRRQPGQQRRGPERLSLRQPVALAADFRERRHGQPPGQRDGHHHRPHHDPRRSAGQGRQPQRLDGRPRIRTEEADSLIAGCVKRTTRWGGSCTAAPGTIVTRWGGSCTAAPGIIVPMLRMGTPCPDAPASVVAGEKVQTGCPLIICIFSLPRVAPSLLHTSRQREFRQRSHHFVLFSSPGVYAWGGGRRFVVLSRRFTGVLLVAIAGGPWNGVIRGRIIGFSEIGNIVCCTGPRNTPYYHNWYCVPVIKIARIRCTK